MKEKWTLIVEADDRDGIPASVKVRRALKSLGRAYRLRCVSVISHQQHAVDAAEGNSAPLADTVVPLSKGPL